MVDPLDLGTPNMRLTFDGPLAWLVIDHPARRNSLSMAMYRALGSAIRHVEREPELDALIITGVDDVFIVGGDIEDHGSDDSALDPDSLPFEAMQAGTIPIVAAVNGHCQASGVQLAALADVSVASERARFRLPELRLGVAAPWSSSILPAVIGLARAKELALTSRSFDADEAHRIGLVTRVVPHEQLHESAREAAFQLLEAGPQARLAWKRAVHGPLRPVDHRSVDESIRTAEANEGFRAFVEKRPPAWSPRASSTPTKPAP